jgi:myo-inositol-1(or 4)-monophosphatase
MGRANPGIANSASAGIVLPPRWDAGNMRALQRRLQTAVDIAAAAGALAVKMRPTSGLANATLKGAHDWLTEADTAVERLISERLGIAHPEDGFQGEEGGFTRTGALHWVVDPIDGTSNYMRGGPRFCVSLGLIEDRSPLVGVVVAPLLGETFAAYVGHGATLNGDRIHVSDTTDVRRATVEVGWSLRRPYSAFIGLCDRVVAAGAAPRVGGSATLGLADVAAGRNDAYAELHINLWDVAAVLTILSEAGARVSRFMDGDGPVSGNPILACTPSIADTLSAATGIRY